MSIFKHISALLLASVMIIGLSACESQGPFEDAGESMDDAFDRTGDAIDDATDGN